MARYINTLMNTFSFDTILQKVGLSQTRQMNIPLSDTDFWQSLTTKLDKTRAKLGGKKPEPPYDFSIQRKTLQKALLIRDLGVGRGRHDVIVGINCMSKDDNNVQLEFKGYNRNSELILAFLFLGPILFSFVAWKGSIPIDGRIIVLLALLASVVNYGIFRYRVNEALSDCTSLFQTL
ncbi:MAG: hypothetical protein ACKVTZ_13005 [Bacteroidia bacterium]